MGSPSSPDYGNSESLNTLLAMGFSEEQIPLALRLADGDLEKAVLYLTGEVPGLDDYMSNSASGTVSRLSNGSVREEGCGRLRLPSTSLSTVQNYIYQGRSLFYKSGNALDRCVKAASKICEEDVNAIDSKLDDFLINSLPEVINRHSSPVDEIRLDAEAIDLCYAFFELVVPLLALSLQRPNCFVVACRGLCEIFNPDSKYNKATRRRDPTPELEKLLAAHDVHTDTNKFLAVNSAPLARLQQGIENFCQENGFVTIQKVVKGLPRDNGDSLEHMLACVQLSNFVIPYLIPSKFIGATADWMDRGLDIIESLHEKDIRSSYARTCVLDLLEELNKLSYHIPSTEHHGENGRLDICRLEFTLKCLKCSQLEARMFALNDLCLLAQSVRENNPIVGEELLNDWLKENKILHAVLSGNLDMAAYVEKTNKLLAYMAPIMSDSDIVYIWSLRKGRLGVSPERFQSIVSHIASQFSFEQMIFTCDLFQKAFKTGEHRTFEKVFNICADVTRTSENDEVVKMIIYQMWDYIVTAKSFHYDISHALDIHAEMISFKKKFDYRDEFVKRSLIVLLKHKDQEKIVLPILFVVYIRNILALGVRETQNISGIVTRKTSVLRAENNAWGDQASDVQRRTELKKLLVEQNLFHHVVRNIIKCQKFAHIRSMELQDCVIPGENSRSCFDIEESLDPFLMDVADGYTYGQVIQFSLKLLAWMFENDVVVYTNDKIQALWSALVESEQSTPPEKSEFFHWIMRLRRDIIKDEALLQFLGLFGKLDPLHITVDGMKAFFEIYHRLAITAIGVNDEDLRKHWNTVWEILENVEDPLVVDNITGRIVKEGVFGDRNSVAARPFVDFCLKRLKRQMEEFEKSKNGCPTEASPTFLRKVNRNLCVLAKFTSVNEANFLYSRTRTLHSTIVPGRPVRVDMYCETFDIDQKALSISTHTNELLAHFKSRIDRRLGFYGIDSYTMHVDWGDDEDREISMRHPWKTLEQIALVPSNEDVLYSNYGILRVRLFIRNINSLRPLQRVSFDTNKVLEDDLPSTFIHTDSSIYSILYSLPIGKDKKMTAVRRQLLDILPNDIKVEKAFEIYKKEVDSNLEYGKCVIKYSFCKIQEVKSVLSLDTPHKFLYGLEVLCGMLMPTRYSIVSAHQSCNTISALTNSDIVEHIMNNVETLCSNFKNYNIAEDSLYLDIIDRANLLLRYFLLNKFTLKESAIEDIEICDHLEHTSPEFGCNKGKMDQIRTVSNIFSSRLETLEKWSLNRIIHFANVWIKIIDVVRSNNNHLLGNLTERGVERFGEEGDRDVFSVEQALYATKDLSSDSLRVSFLRSKLTVECLRLLMEIIQQFVVVKDEAIYYELLSKFVFDNTWTGFAQSILLDGRDNLLRHVGCFYLVSILRKCSMGVSALSLASLCELIVPVLYDERPSSKLNKLDLIRRTNLLDITQTVSSVLVNTTMSGSADDIELWNNVVAGIVDLVVPLTEKIISIDVDRSFELADGALISSLMEIIRGLVASGNLDETITSEVGDFIITKLINGKLFPGYSVNDDNFTDLSSVSPPSRWNDFGIRKQAVALLLDLAATNHGSNAIRLLEKLHLCYENESINGWEFEPDVEEKLYNRVGLKNDGGTCYMNSILQQIYAIEPIARQFVGLDVNTDLVWENGLKSELIVELQRVFGHLYFLLEKICVPRGFWEVFRFSGDDHLDTKKQHDAIDFLTELVDKCDTIMEKMKLPLLFKPQLSGKFAYEYICYECYTRHQGPEEEYLTVNLELHGTTLEDSLQHYVDGEILEGENAYHCRECNSKRTTLRRGSFYTLPNTLSIQLKRFTFDYTGRQAQKNNEYCKFPEFLDMNPYMKHSQTYDSKDIDMLFEEIHSTQKLGSTTKSATGTTPHPSPSSPMKMRRRRRISTLPTQQVNPEDYHYELVGVLAHSGLAAAGHYFSFVKDQNCDSKKSKWFELNDSQVKPFDVESEAENTWFGGHFRASKNVHNLPEERTRTWNAYVLFYQKKPITGFGNTGDITPRIKNLNQNDIFNSMPPWLRLEIVNKNTRFIKERDLYSDEYRDLMLEAANQFYTSMCQLSANERITYKEDMCVKALKFILSFCSRILWRLSSMFRCAVVLEKSQNVLYQLLSCSGNVRRSFLHLLSENNYKIFEDLCDCPNLEVFKSFFDNISFILVSWVTREESIYNSDKEFVFLRKSLRLLKNEYYHNIDNAEIVVDMLAKMGRTEGGLKILWDYEVSSILCDLVVSLYENDHIPRLRISDRDLRHDRLKAIPALFLDILNFGLFQVDQIDESRLALTKISVHYLLTWIYCTTPESRSTREKVVEVLAEADEKLGPEFTASRMNALLHWITTTQVISMNAWESVISLIIRTVIVREKLGHTDCGRALCLFLDEQEVPSAEDSSLHSGVIPWLEHMISKGAIKPCNDMVQALELLYSTKNSTVIPSILATRVERLKIIGQRIEECTYDSQVSGVYDEAECSRKSRTPGFMHPHGPDILDITEVEPIALPSNKMCIDEVERINEATQKTFTATALVTSSSEDIDFKKIM